MFNIMNLIRGIKVAGEFEKVSYKQFREAYFSSDFIKEFTADNSEKTIDAIIKGRYEALKLPVRATTGSAGYDVFAHTSFTLVPGQTITIPTGIRCKMKPGWGAFAFPRSGHGFKYRVRLDNTVGIVDQDYYYSDNEGHIFLKITNESLTEKILMVAKEEAFAQIVFLRYGITGTDKAIEKRNGGMGSTTKK